VYVRAVLTRAVWWQWRCYMQHTGERGVGPPQSWCDPAALGGTVTDEEGSGGSASTGMCRI
jgi:hypothetical protein